jgi:hypothetical protein
MVYFVNASAKTYIGWGKKSGTPKHFAILMIFGTIYLMDISPLLVKFQPYWISKLTTP